MKKFLLCLFMGLFASTNVIYAYQASTSKDTDPSVKAIFKKMFPKAKFIEWERDNNELVNVEFKQDNHQMQAWFKLDGTWVKTEKNLRKKELPQAIQNYLNKNYPRLRIDDIEWIETPTECYYIVELDRSRQQSDIHLKFSEKGQLIK